ncbi:hypothetical protein D3C71_1769750 [compost metagenome]
MAAIRQRRAAVRFVLHVRRRARQLAQVQLMQAHQAALTIVQAVIALDQAGARVTLIVRVRHTQAKLRRQLHHQGFVQCRRPHSFQAADVGLQDMR